MKKEYNRFADSNLFEGMVSLRVLIQNQEEFLGGVGDNDRRIQAVLYDEARAHKEKKEFAWLTHRGEALGFTVEPCSRERIDDLAIGNTHGGIIAFCGHRSLSSFSPDNLSDKGFYVMLEGIEDPYNFGYALRSLYAAGVDGILLPERNWMTAAGVVCRASAGASELLPMFIARDGFIHGMKQKGYKIICADLRDSVSLYDADLSLPLLLVVGGEKRGISASLLENADVRVRIDYARDFDASLSAASAATVAG
ncbi:MAG: RNA methyltransferase, partial [Clostridia bacterium]|nr:RNA methyltransferase [Clostridia bacterium]